MIGEHKRTYEVIEENGSSSFSLYKIIAYRIAMLSIRGFLGAESIIDTYKKYKSTKTKVLFLPLVVLKAGCIDF